MAEHARLRGTPASGRRSRCRVAVVALATSAVVAASSSAEDAKALANKEYQLGRAAFERGDLAEAEPFFLRAAQRAPEYPEPHFALAQILVRQGRHSEAQARMAMAQKQMLTTGVAPAAKSGGDQERAAGGPGGTTAMALAVVAAKAATALPPHHAAIGHALSHISGFLEIGRRSISRMAASADSQDVHNSRIHARQHGEAEAIFRQLCELPTEANLWWQLALNAFNFRRDHMTAAAAFAIVATLTQAVSGQPHTGPSSPEPSISARLAPAPRPTTTPAHRRAGPPRHGRTGRAPTSFRARHPRAYATECFHACDAPSPPSCPAPDAPCAVACFLPPHNSAWS